MTMNKTTQRLAKIALLHHTGGGNLGDDAIIESLVSNIRRRCPDATITAISMNANDTERRHGILSFPMRRHVWDLGYKPAATSSGKGNGFLGWIRSSRNPFIRLPRVFWSELAFLVASQQKIKGFDILVLGGGGQLTDRGGSWAFPYAILVWFLLAKSAGLKCIVLNTGAGPLIHRLSKLFITCALNTADYVSFRDEESQALARRIGFARPSHVFPDNVYGLEIPSIRRSFNPCDRPLVGIAPMSYPTDPPFDAEKDKLVYEELVGKLASFASLLSRRSYLLDLFGTDIGADPAAIEDLRTELQRGHNIAVPEYQPIESLGDVLFRMSTFDYIVTCRFHGVVFAHLLNKPVLAIAHHPKVTDLMNALGLSKYCVDIRTFDPYLLADTFDCLVNDRDEVRSRMASTLKVNKSRLRAQFDELWPVNVTEALSTMFARSKISRN